MKVFKFICIEYIKIWERCYSHERKDDYDFITDCCKFRREAIRELMELNLYISSMSVLKRLSRKLFIEGYKYVKPVNIPEHYTMVWDEYLPEFDSRKYIKYELDSINLELMEKIHNHNKNVLNELIIRKFP